MAFFDKLEKLRERPVHERKRVLFVSMAISMAAVIAIWFSLLKFSASESKEPAIKAPSPWQVIKNIFDTSKKEIKNIK